MAWSFDPDTKAIGQIQVNLSAQSQQASFRVWINEGYWDELPHQLTEVIGAEMLCPGEEVAWKHEVR